MEVTKQQVELEVIEEGREGTEQLDSCCKMGPSRSA